jgi:FkbM family methyltransferase
MWALKDGKDIVFPASTQFDRRGKRVSLVRSVWQAIPNGGVKNWLRLVGHNYTERGKTRFSRKGEAYVTKTSEFTLVTAEPPFEVQRIINQFECRYRVKNGDVVLDAGAFNGVLMSVFALQVGPSGRVLAFEPDAKNRPKVLRNWELNGCPANVEIIPSGLWNCETDVEFCERGALGSSAFWDGPGGRKVKIHTTTLDQIVDHQKLARVDFVKMNIEGSEIKALEGAGEMIRQFTPHFAISSDHFVDGDFARGERTCGPVEHILREHGYIAETVRFGTEWVTYGTPPRK